MCFIFSSLSVSAFIFWLFLLILWATLLEITFMLCHVVIPRVLLVHPLVPNFHVLHFQSTPTKKHSLQPGYDSRTRNEIVLTYERVNVVWPCAFFQSAATSAVSVGNELKSKLVGCRGNDELLFVQTGITGGPVVACSCKRCRWYFCCWSRVEATISTHI